MRVMLPNRSAGLTLMEVLIVVALIGIVFGIGLPSYQGWVRTHIIRQAATDLSQAFKQYRQIAMSQSRTITLSVRDSNSNNSITDDTWTTGLVAYIDADGDSLLDNSETILGGLPDFDGQLVFAAGGLPTPPPSPLPQPTTLITFNPRGLATFNSTGVITLCDDRLSGEESWSVTILVSGFVRKTKGNDC